MHGWAWLGNGQVQGMLRCMACSGVIALTGFAMYPWLQSLSLMTAIHVLGGFAQCLNLVHIAMVLLQKVSDMHQSREKSSGLHIASRVPSMLLQSLAILC